jgi:hypothetical protein
MITYNAKVVNWEVFLPFWDGKSYRMGEGFRSVFSWQFRFVPVFGIFLAGEEG